MGRMGAMTRAAAAILGLHALLAAQAPENRIVVLNRGDAGWQGVVPVSVPFSRGAHKDVQRLRIGDDVAPCETIMRWPDGSARVVRAWPRLVLDPGERRECRVSPTDAPVELVERDRFFDELPMRTVLEDPWGRRFFARFEPDSAAGPDGWSRRGLRCGKRRFRSTHRDEGDSSLGMRAYLTTFAGDRRATLTVLLDNDPADPAQALGPARFRSFAIESRDPRLRFRPRWSEENLLPHPEETRTGYRQVLLRPSDQLYLGDRTAKAFRFDLFADGVGVTDGERERARLPRPFAVPTLAWTRHTRAFGAHGGPAPADDRPDVLVKTLEEEWREGAWFGPFGDFGDPADAAHQGTPRNGPCALHNVLRCESSILLGIAETQVLQHTLRPTPGRAPRLPRAHASLRQGMSPRTIDRPHGFTPVDYEHFSVDLLYDYYWLTADPLARDELVRMGSGLWDVLGGVPFRTPRGEGWCLQAAVSIARATGDDSLVRAVHRHVTDTLLPRLGRDQQPYVLPQPPHEHAFGVTDHPFDVPWQMAALIHGLRALWDETEDLRIAGAIVRTARIMATVGWVDDVGPKYLYSTVDPRRYRLPVGFGPTEGTARMQLGAFVLAMELLEATESEPDRSLLASRADFLRAGDESPAEVARDPWSQIHLDRHR